MKTRLLAYALSFVFLLAALCLSASAEPTAAIRGEAIYRERIAAPPGARLEVSLLDISRADAAALVVSSVSIADAGQPPYRFELGYQSEQIIPSHTYAVRGRLLLGDRLLFNTEETYLVITHGHPVQVNLRLKRVAQKQTPAKAGADRDQHNCIGSAGYIWCAREKACVRPWELAQKAGIASNAAALNSYCGVQ